jgi:hypothetical protein
VSPQPRRLMRHAIHRKGIETDFFFHGLLTDANSPPFPFYSGGTIGRIVASMG